MQFGPESANILLRRTVVAVVISKFDIVKKDLILSSIYLIAYEIVNVSMFLILERSPDDSALRVGQKCKNLTFLHVYYLNDRF